jgi:hypothetical protein
MNLAKKLAVAGSVAAGLSMIGVSALVAAEKSSTGTTRQSALIQALATKFGLSTGDVQKVFDEQATQMRAEQEAKMREAMKTRLDQAVKDGKLTQAQEDALLAKLAEQKTFFESLKDKSPEDRKAAMETQRQAMADWLKANNIPASFGMGFDGPMHGGMRGGFGGHGPMKPGFGKGMFHGMEKTGTK